MALKLSVNNALLKLFRLNRITTIAQAPTRKDQTSALGAEIDKALTGIGMSSSLIGAYGAYMQTEVDRLRQYREYDMMDEESEVITTALDIYAEDATAFDNFVGARVWVTGDNDERISEMNSFLKKIKVEANMPRLARNVAKHGDFFLRVIGKVKKNNKEKGGVAAVDTSYYPGDVFPVVKNRKLYGYVVMNTQSAQSIEAAENYFAPWQFVHFAVPGDSNFYRTDMMMNMQYIRREDMIEYGQSLLKAARRPHKRSKLMHDILAITRLTRSPLKRVFKFVTDTSNPAKAISDLAIFKKTMEKIGGIDQLSDSMNYEEMLNAITQDIYLPIMKENRGDFTVDTIGGQVDVGQIADVELFDNRLFMSLRIPKEHMNFGTVTDRSSALLKDIRYAKRINRLQTCLRAGIRELIFIHYAMQGIVLKENEFEVNMASVSISEDLERLDYYGNAVQTAASLTQMLKDFIDSDAFKQEEETGLSGEAVDPATGIKTQDAKPPEGETPAAVPTPIKKKPSLEKIDQGYLVYYILKHVVKLPAFDLEAFYPGSEKYGNNEKSKKRESVAKNLVESNRPYIEYTFNKHIKKDLKEAAEELNTHLIKEYKNNPVPKSFKFDMDTLTEYFENVIATRMTEEREGKNG